MPKIRKCRVRNCKSTSGIQQLFRFPNWWVLAEKLKENLQILPTDHLPASSSFMGKWKLILLRVHKHVCYMNCVCELYMHAMCICEFCSLCGSFRLRMPTKVRVHVYKYIFVCAYKSIFVKFIVCFIFKFLFKI